MRTLLKVLIQLLPAKMVYAHCDIPCGIYDPHGAQIAAHTVIRMVNLINDVKASSANPPFEERKKIISQVARLTKVKEEHAELVKHETRILWGDYFKPDYVKDHPELHELVFQTMKLASKARQNVDIDVANELLANVQKIAEIFWKTKGVKTARMKSPYPSGGEIVIPKA